MTGRVETAGGAVYELPELLEWRLLRTGGVPCDSFRARCLFRAGMEKTLKEACRFTAVEDGALLFRGVVDEWSAELSGAGTVLTIEGRGMAALLLDNEAEAAHYQRATLEEILKDHAAVCGVRWETACGGRSLAEYSVASGSSRWRASCGAAVWRRTLRALAYCSCARRRSGASAALRPSWEHWARCIGTGAAAWCRK